ncbi:MAG: hypothetical protein ARM1_0528 [Candidatus Micrarchaeota archaeon]|nr:MAG: hypothetical protein ARM1_0528 [Candidatus Micrarchaeota archaeon]
MLNSDDYDLKICCYSDARVAPYGIVSVAERFDDLIKRRKGSPAEKKYIALKGVVKALEKQLFSNAPITPNEINDATADVIIREFGKDAF